MLTKDIVNTRGYKNKNNWLKDKITVLDTNIWLTIVSHVIKIDCKARNACNALLYMCTQYKNTLTVSVMTLQIYH